MMKDCSEFDIRDYTGKGDGTIKKVENYESLTHALLELYLSVKIRSDDEVSLRPSNISLDRQLHRGLIQIRKG